MKIPKIKYVYDRKHVAGKGKKGPIDLRITYNCKQMFVSTGNITSLYAKKGEEEENDHVFSIGAGRDGRCGGVFIGGQQLTFSGPNGENKGQVFDPEVTMYICNKVHYDTNTGGVDIGTMESQGIIEVRTSTYPPKNDPFISVSTCKLTRYGYAFVNWNTQADGTGTVYEPGDIISKWGSQGDEMTLYAQWMPDEKYFDQPDKGNSEDDPFEISNAEQLKLLASRVNDPSTESHQVFSDKYFKVMNDITFSYDGLDETESNFTAIGNDDNIRYFGGHFDGNGHTISGIRIYKGGEGQENNYQGLFGYIAPGAEVKNVILTDAIIAGNTYVGGIVGYNDNGTVTNCHATSSVTIRAVANGAAYHGGIVGDNSGENAVVSNCFSAATLTIEGALTNCSGYGGIVGINYAYDSNKATVRNCIAAGATIPAYKSIYGPTYGAVVGINECTLENNYYTACTVDGVENATGVGCSQYEGSELVQSDIDGAKPALLDNEDNTSAIAILGAIDEAIGTYKVCLNGRTLYKDGYWNTLCLPFDLKDFTGTPLEGAKAMTLDISSRGNTGFDHTTGTLTLDFLELNEIYAGEPFIVRWGTPENPGVDIKNPVFPSVRIEDFDLDQRGYKINQLIRFGGTFKPVNIYTEPYHYKLYLGAGNKLYYPTSNFEVNAFRSYFELLGSLYVGTPESQVKEFVLNFGDENTTGILEVSEQSDKSDNWYSLDGIRLSKRPSTKGIYINNGQKIIIK